jgi:hypothetical protein
LSTGELGIWEVLVKEYNEIENTKHYGRFWSREIKDLRSWEI